ncbi:MAG: glycosyltransferase family 2 protein [Gammaproteobacteria bacterium]
MNLKVSLIITTYNWPEALAAVLDTIARQEQLPHEVVIADDGSMSPTKEIIERYQRDFPVPLHHVWHPDNGYQASKIRNKAVMRSSGNYLVFLDGDCLLRSDYIAQHRRLARSNYFISGNRVLLSKAYTEKVLSQHIDVSKMKPFEFAKENINRRWSLLPIPLGVCRFTRPNTWEGVKACNMSMFAKDFVEVNGFEEQFEGWGYEDSDLIVRLLNKGVQRISGRFAVTVIHLWHNTHKSLEEKDNWKRLQSTIADKRRTATLGLSQYEA